MGYLNLTAAAQPSLLDELETWLWRNGALSVTIEDGGDDPIFEPRLAETPLWGKVLVTGLFDDDLPVAQLGEGLLAAGFELVATEELADRTWEREWLDRFKPMRFGERLWVCPSGHELDPMDKVVVHLDPGLAFGSGTHETTRLCLEWLDAAQVKGKTVIDYGCGSGILAVAAALLGASEVHAVDIDPQAVAATERNAEHNGASVTAGLVADTELPQADIILANLLAQPLVELAPSLCGLAKPQGTLVLSGIMEGQEWVSDAYERMATLNHTSSHNGWLLLSYTMR